MNRNAFNLTGLAVALMLVLTMAAVAQEKDAAAEKAWNYLTNEVKPSPPPAEWQTTQPTQEQVDAFHKKNGEIAGRGADLAREFYTKYPAHVRAAEAKEKELKLTEVAVQLGYTNKTERLQELRKEMVNAPGVSDTERFRLRVLQVQEDAAAKRDQGIPAYLDALEQGARQLMKEFPNRTEPVNFLIQIVNGSVQSGEIERARRLGKEIEASKAPEAAKNLVRAQLKRFDTLDKPFIFMAPSVEGKEISMEKLRGKVVLFDFWASWCGPCMAEVPNMKEVYAKFNSKGFEIIGVNLDETVDILKETIKKNGMTWPQHFDANNPEGGWAGRYGISAIPAMWLVDKKGVLRDLNAREDLASKVEKLMAEPSP